MTSFDNGTAHANLGMTDGDGGGDGGGEIGLFGR